MSSEPKAQRHRSARSRRWNSVLPRLTSSSGRSTFNCWQRRSILVSHPEMAPAYSEMTHFLVTCICSAGARSSSVNPRWYKKSHMPNNHVRTRRVSRLCIWSVAEFKWRSQSDLSHQPRLPSASSKSYILHHADTELSTWQEGTSRFLFGPQFTLRTIADTRQHSESKTRSDSDRCRRWRFQQGKRTTI